MNTRLCLVGGKYGYFHMWEQYSEPLPSGLFIGSAPAGQFSRVYGIVELEDGVRRVIPAEISFVDEEHGELSCMNRNLERIQEAEE